jgi:hypothetical protein
MILTDQSPHFTRDGDRWRCVERPGLTMRGDHCEVEGREFRTLAEAVRWAGQRAQAMDVPEADQQAWIAFIEERYRAIVTVLPPTLECCDS